MSCFDESMVTPRVSLDIRTDCEHTLAYFDALDDWTVTYLAANSERIFNKTLSLWSRLRLITTPASSGRSPTRRS